MIERWTLYIIVWKSITFDLDSFLGLEKALDYISGNEWTVFDTRTCSLELHNLF